MPQYLPLPDGTSLLMKDGENAHQAMARALEQFPDAFGFSPEATAQPESGFIPAAKASGHRLVGGIEALLGRTGLKDLAAAEEAQKQHEARAQQIFKRARRQIAGCAYF